MSQVLLGVIAVVFGVMAGLLLFVPAVAVSYRRHGRLALSTLALWAAALVYFMAVWVYTLLPMPEPGAIVCTHPQLDPFAFVDDLRGAAASGSFLTDAGFLQLALNVLLFVPLGILIRLIWRRGIVVSLVAGVLLSLLIETTQVTGVWGLYPCAYRLFDVDDLLTNTLGAVVGSLLSLLIAPRLRVRPDRLEAALLPHPVTRVRRLVASLSDFLSVTLTAVATAVVIALGAALTVGDHVLDPSAAWVTWTVALVPFVLSTGFFLVTGRTIGQAAVQLRYVGSPYPRVLAGLLVYGGGIGGYQVISAIPAISGWATPLFAAVAVVMVFTTRGARGLPGVLSRSHLVDSREAVRADPDVAMTEDRAAR
ncbi:VanZ family protein [Microbacter sp. GSS18]|nr:VanZ family protein [Microbacter sp. GSS18]